MTGIEQASGFHVLILLVCGFTAVILYMSYRLMKLSADAAMLGQCQRDNAQLKSDLVMRQQTIDQRQQACHELEKRLESHQVHAQVIEQRLVEQQEECRALAKTNEELNKTLQQFRDRLSEQTQRCLLLESQLHERQTSYERELAQFEKQKASLTEHFQALSNEILENKSKMLAENSKITLSSVMTPFQQSIDAFKKEVQDIHHREAAQQGALRQELQSLKLLNQKMTDEAHELSTALRGQKKLQGNWGELILENVLDRSGLQLGKDYQREVSVNTEEGRKRPDAIVFLPQNKHLVIDAKVSLNAYTRYVNAEDELSRSQALQEHVCSVSARIRELASKNYDQLPGLTSPEIVFMFIPIESAFVEALKADETLFELAIQSNILVATPTTLLTSLNIVRQLWRFEDQNKHTAALAKKAESVFNKLNNFLRSFERIKKCIDDAGDAYSNAEKQLLNGRGNLVKQVSEFKNLAPAIKAELPGYFVERADLELDYTQVESMDVPS